MLETHLYEHMTDFLGTIRTTASADGTYRAIPGAPMLSVDPDPRWGLPLADMVQACETMDGFAATLATIESIVTAITAHVSPPQRITRQRTTGRSGYALNRHAVNRGQLASAWKRTRRAPHVGEEHITLGIEAGYPGHVDPGVALLRQAATLALCALLEQSGRRCDVWSVQYGTSLTPQGPDMLCAVHLHAAGTAWSTHNVACVADPAFLRRLCFRQFEAAPWGVHLPSGYFAAEPLQSGCALLAQHLGFPVIHPGVSWKDIPKTNTLADAQAWVQAALQRLTTREGQ